MPTVPSASSTPLVVRAEGAPVLDVFGVSVLPLAGGAETKGVCSIARIVCPPGAGSPPHFHEQTEHFHVIHGALTVRCGDETIELESGDFIQVPPGAVHAFSNTSDQPVEFLAIATPAGHERFFRDADELARSGRFNPDTAAALCRRHGIGLTV